MRSLSLLLALAIMTVTAQSASAGHSFDESFSDSTLRVDFTLSGPRANVGIGLQSAEKSAGWNGRRVNIDHLPVRGNGRFYVVDKAGSDTIYCNSFSTLYQEWLATGEADSIARSMSLTILMPLPRNKCDIVVELSDNYGRQLAKGSFPFDPSDINLRAVDGQSAHQWSYIVKNGEPREKIDVAILPEGYTSEEMAAFRAHALRAVRDILDMEPFKSNADKFNFLMVEVPSAESGVSVPHDGEWRSTAFNSSYNTFGSPRYLTTSDLGSIHDALRGIPYEHIIILANEKEYGGGGIYNLYALTTALHPLFDKIVVHEFGHSFGALADEYFYDGPDVLDDTYPLEVEPWEGNITTLVNFDSKWKDIVVSPSGVYENTDSVRVGLFEGGGYRTKGIYRPTDKSCRMHFNEAESFCPVCQKLIADMIRFNLVEKE